MTSSPSIIPTPPLDSTWTPPTATPGDTPGELNRMAGNSSLDEPICFRICGIPSGLSRDQLEGSLRAIYPQLDLQSSRLSALFPACCGPSQTALLTVHRHLEYYILPARDKEGYHSFRVIGRDEDVRLRIDKHFHDLTPMNIPVRPIRVDLIAITGLSGHAFGSWRSRVGTVGRPLDRPMWLRDFLPESFPQTRIMIYGYDSSLSRPTGYNLLDYARGFEQCIMNARRDCPQRPIIFVAHSLGGLLVNQLLLTWAQRQESNALLDCVRGIFFFGTPHDGLRTKELSEMVDKGIWDKKTQILLAQLAEGCEFLESQKDCLSRMWNRFRGKLFTFYETEKTNVVKEATPGVWNRSGDLFQMVQRSSAQLFLPNELRFPVQSNHTDMVKFNSPDDKAFQDVLTCMKSCDAQYDRATVINSLVQTVLPRSDTVFYLDKPQDYNRWQDHDGIENTADCFLLLHGLDYQNWISKTAQIQTLAYRLFPCLPYIMPHLIHILRNTEQNCLLLFYTPTRGQSIAHAGSLDLLMLCGFLRQVVETFPSDQGQSLLHMFLHNLLMHLGDDDLAVVQNSRPERGFDDIIYCSSHDVLWTALEEVLAKAAGLHACPGTAKPGLKILLDLNSTRSEWRAETAVRRLRLLMARLRRAFSTVKLLITDPPETAIPHLQKPFTVLVSYDEERKECLRTLYFKNFRYDKISVHHSHTLAWLWESSEYKSWVSLEHPDSGLLFIEGKPGSGKSTLVRYFADTFTPQRSEAIVLKFFYNTRDGEPERDHRNMLRSLLYQILKADESFFVHFQSIYRQGGESKIEWCSNDMKKILRACKTHSRPRTIYLIIDAMDESACTDRADIVQFLHELSAPALSNGGCMVNVFLASRPINEIQFSSRRRKILLQEMNRGDIERYTHCLLQTEDFNPVNPEVKQEIEEYILNFSDGVFIWVYLVLKELAVEAMNGSRKSTLISFLKSLPKSLENLYECMLQRLARNKGQARTDGKRILQFCLFSERAMALVDLNHALAIPGLAEDEEPDSKSWASEIPLDIYKMLNHCVGGFVDVKANKKTFPAVQVMHQTVREFFLRPRDLVRRSHLNVIKQDALNMIELTCVRFLEIVCKEGAGLVLCRRPSRNSIIYMRRHLEYLERRPFIKYSLEYLEASLKAWAPGIAHRMSILLDKVENSPPSLTMVIFSRLISTITIERSFQIDIQYYLNRLMIHAAIKGYSTAIRNLLAISPTLNAKSERQETPLHLAAGGGHYETTMFLLDSGAYIDAKDIGQRTALHHATLNGHEAISQLLLTTNPGLEAHSDSMGQTALHLASLNGLEALVRLLLTERNTTTNKRDNDGCTPLHFAARNGHSNVAHLLLENGADVLAQDSSRKNALHHAAMYGHQEVVQLLLTSNADPNCRDSNHQTPLHLASMNGHSNVVHLLLENGADVLAQDCSRQNALHYAAMYGHQEVVQLLLTSNADPNCQDSMHQTSLHLASMNGESKIVYLLLENGADVLAKDLSHKHALHHAVINGHEAIVQLILNNNANLEAMDVLGRTALHFAAHRGDESIFQLLLVNNADLQATDHYGQTAIDHANRNGHGGIVRFRPGNHASLRS